MTLQSSVCISNISSTDRTFQFNVDARLLFAGLTPMFLCSILISYWLVGWLLQTLNFSRQRIVVVP